MEGFIQQLLQRAVLAADRGDHEGTRQFARLAIEVQEAHSKHLARTLDFIERVSAFVGDVAVKFSGTPAAEKEPAGQASGEGA